MELFLLDDKARTDGGVILTGAEARHISRVLHVLGDLGRTKGEER